MVSVPSSGWLALPGSIRTTFQECSLCKPCCVLWKLLCFHHMLNGEVAHLAVGSLTEEVEAIKLQFLFQEELKNSFIFHTILQGDFYFIFFCLRLLLCKLYLILVEAHCHCAVKVVKNSQEERKKQTRSRHHRTAQTDRRRGSKQELWWMQRHYGQEVLQ